MMALRRIAVDTDGRLLMVNLTPADISNSAGAGPFSPASASAGPGSSTSPTAISSSSWQGPPISTSAAPLGDRTHLRLDARWQRLVRDYEQRSTSPRP